MLGIAGRGAHCKNKLAIHRCRLEHGDETHGEMLGPETGRGRICGKGWNQRYTLFIVN